MISNNNFGLNVTGQFNNLTSSSNFNLPLKNQITSGIPGSNGIPGAGSLVWKYNGATFSSGTAEGEFMTSVTDMANITSISITKTDINSVNVNSWLQTFDLNTVQITQQTDSSMFGIYLCISVSASSTFQLSFSPIAGNGTLIVGEKYVIGSLPTGTVSSSIGGSSGDVQFNLGGSFAGSDRFTWNDPVFTIKDTYNSGNRFVWDAGSWQVNTPNFYLGRPIQGNYQLSTEWNMAPTVVGFPGGGILKELKLLSEPDYTQLSGSIVNEPSFNIMSGVHLMTQVVSNKSKGITSMWPFGTPVNKQIYNFHGHDFDLYSSFNPLEDSILYTKKQNENPLGKTQPPATMDLGMSSRLPTSSSNGSNQYGWNALPWVQVGGDDNPYVDDIYAKTTYTNWKGQQLIKSAVPGIYIEERRWDRIIGRSNFTGSVSIRSTFSPNLDPDNKPVSGVDFYDLELAQLENTTNNTDWRAASKMNFGMARLDVLRSNMVLPDLLTISTEQTLDLGTTGVNFDTPGIYGSASLYFKNYDGANGTNPSLPSVYTALIDGTKGTIKCIGNVSVGNSTAGSTNIMTTTDTNISALWKGTSSVVDVGSFGVGTNGSVGYGQLSLKGDNGVESLLLKGINSVSGPAPFKSIDMTTGLAYFTGLNYGASNGPNGDHVGVMNISNSSPGGKESDVLQLNSVFELTTYSPPTTASYGTNLLNCKNSTTTLTDKSLFKVDVAGKVNQQTNQNIDGVVFQNSIDDLPGPTSFTNSVLVSRSQSRAALPPYHYDAVVGGGFSFLKCTLPNVAGGVAQTRCQIDGDGSIKNMTSITVSDGQSAWPPNGNSRNITLLPGGTDSLITTRYSTHSAGSGLSFQAEGPVSSTFTYKNMINILPNAGTTTIGLKFKSATSPATNAENFLWWSGNSDVSSSESLWMRVKPKTTGANRPIFEMQGGGTLGTNVSGGPNTPYFLRYYPETIDSNGVPGKPPIIIGDDRNVIIQMGGGKNTRTTFPLGEPTGQTASTQGKLSVNVIDCNYIDASVISGGTNTSALLIGLANTKEVNIYLGGSTNGSGSLNLGKSGCITSELAPSPSGGSTGPTNICNKNHSGYIGTLGLLPSNGTGLRGFSCIASSFAAASKLYIATNNAPTADGNYLCCSSVESTQGVVIMRGQVQLSGHSAIVDIDLATSTPKGLLIIPHTNPAQPLPVGTFQKMYQNPTVMVTNAGIVSQPVPIKLATDTAFTAVQGIISEFGVSNTILTISANPAGAADIVVNYTISCERADLGYTNPVVNPFVQAYKNPHTNSTVTWGSNFTPAQMDELYGTGEYEFN